MLARIEGWLTPGAWMADLIEPLFRVMTSLIFIIGGLGHFGQHQVMLARMQESPWYGVVTVIGDPSMLLWLSGLVFVVFGLTLAIGWIVRISAIMLFLTLVPVTIAVHVVPDTAHVGPLLKNVAILGALLSIWARGGGRYALGNRRMP